MVNFKLIILTVGIIGSSHLIANDTLEENQSPCADIVSHYNENGEWIECEENVDYDETYADDDQSDTQEVESEDYESDASQYDEVD